MGGFESILFNQGGDKDIRQWKGVTVENNRIVAIGEAESIESWGSRGRLFCESILIVLLSLQIGLKVNFPVQFLVK